LFVIRPSEESKTMRRILVLSTLALVLTCSFSLAAETLRPGEKVAIIGDSITEQKQYSVFMEDYLLMCQPTSQLTTMQFGWSGETARGFNARIQNDFLRYKFSAATTCFGMNDGGYSPQTDSKAKSYHDSQLAIVKAMKQAGIRLIVVGSPGAVDTYTFKHNKDDTTDALSSSAEMYNKTLASERDLAKKVAEEEGVVFANVFDPMVMVMEKAKAKYGNKYHVCGGDGVHPGANGQFVMAYAFLKGLGCDGTIGTITVDLSSSKAEATTGHKVLSAKDGAVEIESTRYPFCFLAAKGAKLEDPGNVRGILEFLPFNQELNRYMLVVKGPASGKVKVTWGETSKEFDAADLAKGINLAAEFLDNPFVEPFKNVHAAVKAQQDFETPMIKSTIHKLGFPPKGATAPTEAEAKKIADDAAAKQAELSAAAVKAVEPVKHTIKIEVLK
jgi:lysophospholipase L1-like esterase